MATYDIPIPPPRRQLNYKAILRQLRPGGSELLDMAPKAAYMTALRALGKGHFRCRKERNGTRVWRLPDPTA